jgi:hypothetical protein
MLKFESASPHRLAAQDAALSRPKQGFESPWGHFFINQHRPSHTLFRVQAPHSACRRPKQGFESPWGHFFINHHRPSHTLIQGAGGQNRGSSPLGGIFFINQHLPSHTLIQSAGGLLGMRVFQLKTKQDRNHYDPVSSYYCSRKIFRELLRSRPGGLFDLA